MLFGPELAAKAKGKLIIGKTPGRYRVRAWNAKADVPSDLATCWVVIDGPAPSPTPPPAPPSPQAVANFIVGVTDNTARTLQQGAILSDDALFGYLRTQKIGWRVFDINSQALRDYKLDKVLAERKLAPPAIIAWGTDGSIRAAPAPASSDGVKQFIDGKTFVRFAPERGLHYYQHGKTKRWLNRLAPSKDSVQALHDCGVKRWRNVKTAIPRDQWRTVSRRNVFPAADWVLDQGQHGSCVGHGSASAFRATRFCAGMRDLKLSPTCVYAQINGGADDGAIIGDLLIALQKTGTILFASTSEDRIYLHQMPAGWQSEAARFKIEEAHTTPTFDEIVSAVQLGYVVVFGMEVGNNFEAFDKYGVAGYSGGAGNHCLFIDGCTLLPDGRWVVDVVNSWGADWGPWKVGRCYMTERHINGADNSDAYAIRTATEDPKETIKPPTVAW